MQRLQERTGARIYRQLGLLWRDTATLPRLQAALDAEQVGYSTVPAHHVGRYFPGLRQDERDAIWIPEAGTVLAEASLRAQLQLFTANGGELVSGRTVVRVDDRPSAVVIGFADAGPAVRADVAVLAPGPGAVALLPTLGIHVPVRPFAEQVVHLGDSTRPHALDNLPCLFDGPNGDEPGIYAMPSPGLGYKIGIDAPLRALNDSDTDRTPQPERTRAIVERAIRDLTTLPTTVIDEQVCTWTDSPDGRFILDRMGGIVLACGDSGEGFKYSALMGDLLADLAEDRAPDPDVAALSLTRFAHTTTWPPNWAPTSIGSH